jgi:hypothetical protein
MQVWPIVFSRWIRLFGILIEECDWDAVAAAIIVCRCVQWLVQVADEVYDVSQRVGSCLSVCFWIAKDRKLIGNRFCDAAGGRRTVLIGVSLWRSSRNINEVPEPPVSGSTPRSSSAQVDESANASRPLSPQYRRKSGLIGLAARIFITMARASEFNCDSAISAMI